MLFTCCFVWPIIKTLVNGACSPVQLPVHLGSPRHFAKSALGERKKKFVLIIFLFYLNSADKQKKSTHADSPIADKNRGKLENTGRFPYSTKYSGKFRFEILGIAYLCVLAYLLWGCSVDDAEIR